MTERVVTVVLWVCAVVLIALPVLALVGCEDTRSDLEKAVSYFPAEQRAKAAAVAWCESRGDRWATSPGGTYRGIFQIGRQHAGAFEWLTGQPYYDEVYNADMNGVFAWALWVRDGWGAWSCA